MDRNQKTKQRRQGDPPAMTGPGVEKGRVPAVEEAANTYVRHRDARMKLVLLEAESKARLIGAMRAHGLSVYDYDSYVVTLTPKDDTPSVKVIKKKDDETEVEMAWDFG
jgi:hypothetical protein